MTIGEWQAYSKSKTEEGTKKEAEAETEAEGEQDDMACFSKDKLASLALQYAHVSIDSISQADAAAANDCTGGGGVVEYSQSGLDHS